jgi:hypothetical protein
MDVEGSVIYEVMDEEVTIIRLPLLRVRSSKLLDLS